jgi:hypothetical protein
MFRRPAYASKNPGARHHQQDDEGPDDPADNRRVSNGGQVTRVAALAMKRGKSVDFTGYWQRHVAG